MPSSVGGWTSIALADPVHDGEHLGEHFLVDPDAIRPALGGRGQRDLHIAAGQPARAALAH